MGRERSGLRNIDTCTTHSGIFCHGYVRRTPNHQESFFNNTRNQPSPWHEKANKAWPSIFFLRTVTTYRIEKFCVDFKVINNFHIHIHITKIITLIVMIMMFLYYNNTITIKDKWITNYYQKEIIQSISLIIIQSWWL